MSPNIGQLLAAFAADYDDLYRCVEGIHEALTDLDNKLEERRITVAALRGALPSGKGGENA